MLLHYAEKLKNHVSDHETISLSDFLGLIEDRALVFVLILLAFLNIILAPLPGNSVIIGIPMFLTTVCILFKVTTFQRVPFFLDRPVKCAPWREYMDKLVPYIAKFERLAKPRFQGLFHMVSQTATGLCLVVLAFIILLPIPFANIPGSLGIIFLCLGSLQRDGVLFGLGCLIFWGHVVVAAVMYQSLLAVI